MFEDSTAAEIAAAAALADQMRALGDARITLCQERTGWGVCRMAVVDGRCRYPGGHLA